MLIGEWLLGAACLAGPFAQIEITSEPPVDNQQVFTVRFTPALTHYCDAIVFKCFYRQEFPWEASTGEKGVKVHEPASFSYKRKDVKMVEELDNVISFKVPIGMEKLQEMFGLNAFKTNYPARVARMVINGISKTGELWRINIETNGVYKFNLTATNVLGSTGNAFSVGCASTGELGKLEPPSNALIRQIGPSSSATQAVKTGLGQARE